MTSSPRSSDLSNSSDLFTVPADTRTATADLPSWTSGTRLGTVLNRFSAFAASWAIGAAGSSAAGLPARRRVYSEAETSATPYLLTAWMVADFSYSEEWITQQQVDALNALLALPAAEGFSVEFPD